AALHLAAPGEPCRAYPPVELARDDPDQSVPFERAQEAAEVAGIQPEPAPEATDVAALGADLPQHARFAERALAREIVVVERSDALGDEPVEAAHPAHRGVGHSLILVRERHFFRSDANP